MSKPEDFTFIAGDFGDPDDPCTIKVDETATVLFGQRVDPDDDAVRFTFLRDWILRDLADEVRWPLLPNDQTHVVDDYRRGRWQAYEIVRNKLIKEAKPRGKKPCP